MIFSCWLVISIYFTLPPREHVRFHVATASSMSRVSVSPDPSCGILSQTSLRVTTSTSIVSNVVCLFDSDWGLAHSDFFLFIYANHMYLSVGGWQLHFYWSRSLGSLDHSQQAPFCGCQTCVARVFSFSFFCWFLATYSIKFYIIGFVSSCCVQWAFDCRVLKSVDGIIGLESSSQFRVD